MAICQNYSKLLFSTHYKKPPQRHLQLVIVVRSGLQPWDLEGLKGGWIHKVEE